MKLYKVMWLPEEQILWDMFSESIIDSTNEAYKSLSDIIDLEEWIKKYSIEFGKWLNDSESQIYNLNSTLNGKMINAIAEVNKSLMNCKLYYWFDIDRTYNEDHKWVKCPLSNQPLIDLGPNYPSINRLVSDTSFLVLPYE